MRQLGKSKLLFYGVLVLVACMVPAMAVAEVGDSGIVTLQIENDVIVGTDRNYTNGMLATYLSPPTTSARHLSRQAANRIPFLDPDDKLRFGLGIGHNLYTPENKSTTFLVEDDRPYAAWLYLSLSLLSYEGLEDVTGLSGDFGMMQTLVLDLGVIGPWAQGETTQNEWHSLIGVERANGWDNQLENEPAINLTYERKWRYQYCCDFEASDVNLDLMPSAGGAIGNVMTYAATGLILRLGTGLDSDFGAPRIRPSLPGSAYFEPQGFGWYLFAGVEGRAVAHNIFLDGNTFRDSHSIDKRYFTADAQVGIAVVLDRLRVSYTQVFATSEGKGLAPHQFGSFSVSWRLTF